MTHAQTLRLHLRWLLVATAVDGIPAGSCCRPSLTSHQGLRTQDLGNSPQAWHSSIHNAATRPSPNLPHDRRQHAILCRQGTVFTHRHSLYLRFSPSRPPTSSGALARAGPRVRCDRDSLPVRYVAGPARCVASVSHVGGFSRAWSEAARSTSTPTRRAQCPATRVRPDSGRLSSFVKAKGGCDEQAQRFYAD